MKGAGLDGQVALVTGGSRGIGRAIATGLAEAGADVVVASRSSETLETAVAEIKGLGHQALGIRTDVSRLEDIRGLVAETVRRFGRIDILVNNAAVNPLWKRAEKLTQEDWDLLMAVDLRGAFFVCQEVGKVMIGQRAGKIIVITSVTATRGTARGPPIPRPRRASSP